MGEHALLHALITWIRGSWSKRWPVSAALGISQLLASSAHAQTLEPTLLSYRAPDECPEVADFQKSVQRRSARVRFVDEGSHERELSIVLRKRGDFTIGELRLIEPDGSLRQRSVRFTSCSEAVEGLALIAVVSLDPQALLSAPSPKPKPEEKPEPPIAPSKVLPKALEAVRAPATTRRPVRHAKNLEVALGAELVASFRQVPQIALGGALFVDVADDSASLFAPLLRLAIAHSERRGIPSGDGQVSFALTQSTLTACPLQFGHEIISVRPCAFTTVGLLRAWSSDAAGPQARSRPSWAWGGSVFAFLRISQTAEMIADLSVASSLVRDRFEVQPAWSWVTPPLYLSSGVGLRIAFR